MVRAARLPPLLSVPDSRPHSLLLTSAVARQIVDMEASSKQQAIERLVHDGAFSLTTSVFEVLNAHLQYLLIVT